MALPFHPGEWRASPLKVAEAVPYSWHPDGTVRRVAFFRSADEDEVDESVVIRPSRVDK